MSSVLAAYNTIRRGLGFAFFVRLPENPAVLRPSTAARLCGPRALRAESPAIVHVCRGSHRYSWERLPEMNLTIRICVRPSRLEPRRTLACVISGVRNPKMIVEQSIRPPLAGRRLPWCGWRFKGADDLHNSTVTVFTHPAVREEVGTFPWRRTSGRCASLHCDVVRG
jgi:hypothetical protein